MVCTQCPQRKEMNLLYKDLPHVVIKSLQPCSSNCLWCLKVIIIRVFRDSISIRKHCGTSLRWSTGLIDKVKTKSCWVYMMGFMVFFRSTNIKMLSDGTLIDFYPKEKLLAKRTIGLAKRNAEQSESAKNKNEESSLWCSAVLSLQCRVKVTLKKSNLTPKQPSCSCRLHPVWSLLIILAVFMQFGDVVQSDCVHVFNLNLSSDSETAFRLHSSAPIALK